MDSNIHTPLVILLTHRRGAALSVFKNSLDVDGNTYPFVRTLGKTAENLLDAYNSILKLAKLSPSEIKTLAVGTGPGSFTGLRLGCAFANGIKLGQNCRLISFRTELVPYFLNGSFLEQEEDLREFKKQLGDYDPHDESTGLVTFYDMLDAVQKLKTAIEVDVLEPNYGREPGPVLKLKGIHHES